MTTRSTLTAALAFLTLHATAALAQTPPSEPPTAQPAPGEPSPTPGEAGQVPPIEAPPPPAKKKGLPVSGTYDGGFTVRSDDGTFELKINGLMQTRWDFFSRPAATDGGDRTSESKFSLPRGRLGLSGYVWKDTQFKIEYAFSDAGNPRLRDFWFNQVLAGGTVQLRAGQMKKPFNRSEIVSDFGTVFLEKAITNTFGSRDIGVLVHNGFDKSPEGLEWAIGIWNGQGDALVYPVSCTVPMGSTTPSCTIGTPSNTPSGNFRPEAEARVAFNYGGIKGYSEGDFEGGGLRFAVGANARIRNIQDLETRPLAWDLGVDAVVKVMGLDVWAAAFLTKNKENLSQAVLDTRDDDPQLAFHLQAGYMVLPKQLLVAARFARFPLATPAMGTDLEYNQEVRAAVAWFFSKSHNYKLSADFGFEQPTTEGSDPTWVVRTGAQFIF